MPLAIEPVVSANQEDIRRMKPLYGAVNDTIYQRKEVRVIIFHGSDEKHGGADG